MQFSIIGDGADRLRLTAEAKKRGLDNIEFPGLVPKAEIPATLRRASVCLVHLRKDPLFETVIPSKLFEAMAAKRPIILGVRGSAASLVEKAECGVVIEPENSGQLIEALKQISGSSSKLRRWGENGRRFVAHGYSRDLWAKNYLACLHCLGIHTSSGEKAAS